MAGKLDSKTRIPIFQQLAGRLPCTAAAPLSLFSLFGAPPLLPCPLEPSDLVT